MIDERLKCLELELKHVEADVMDIKSQTKDLNHTVKLIELSLAKLTILAETSGNTMPKIEKLEAQINRNSLKLAVYSGGLAVIVFVSSFAKLFMA